MNRFIFKSYFHLKCSFVFLVSLGLMISAPSLFAQQSLGTVAERMTESFIGLAHLVSGGCYIAGLGFAVTAILQFKQHKDNPTQIPVGKPISLVFIAAALLFMPSVLGVAGMTMFGDEALTAGPKGLVFQA